MSKTTTAFISGPIEIDQAYFDNYYKPKIDAAIQKNHHFVIGPTRGADATALKYLLSSGVHPSRINVYLTNQQAHRRKNYANIEKNGGNVIIFGSSQAERDAAMTRNSHYDILRYRTEDEAKLAYGPKWYPCVTNTEKNEIRRKSGVGLVWNETVSTLETPTTERSAPKDQSRDTLVIEETISVSSSLDAAGKKVRSLSKKLKGIEDLKARHARGEKLEATQIKKMEVEAEIRKELEELRVTS